jgi:hypothetical protein
MQACCQTASHKANGQWLDLEKMSEAVLRRVKDDASAWSETAGPKHIFENGSWFRSRGSSVECIGTLNIPGLPGRWPASKEVGPVPNGT